MWWQEKGESGINVENVVVQRHGSGNSNIHKYTCRNNQIVFELTHLWGQNMVSTLPLEQHFWNCGDSRQGTRLDLRS